MSCYFIEFYFNFLQFLDTTHLFESEIQQFFYIELLPKTFFPPPFQRCPHHSQFCMPLCMGCSGFFSWWIVRNNMIQNPRMYDLYFFFLIFASKQRCMLPMLMDLRHGGVIAYRDFFVHKDRCDFPPWVFEKYRFFYSDHWSFEMLDTWLIILPWFLTVFATTVAL